MTSWDWDCLFSVVNQWKTGTCSCGVGCRLRRDLGIRHGFHMKKLHGLQIFWLFFEGHNETLNEAQKLMVEGWRMGLTFMMVGLYQAPPAAEGWWLSMVVLEFLQFSTEALMISSQIKKTQRRFLMFFFVISSGLLRCDAASETLPSTARREVPSRLLVLLKASRLTLKGWRSSNPETSRWSTASLWIFFLLKDQV